MNNNQIMETALKQSALEANCRPVNDSSGGVFMERYEKNRMEVMITGHGRSIFLNYS